jgi:hypothetical protein
MHAQADRAFHNHFERPCKSGSCVLRERVNLGKLSAALGAMQVPETFPHDHTSVESRTIQRNR